jgi:FAD-linked sulfhydryl oxidase
MHSGCPVTRRELGRASWAYLHTLAAYYPDKPSEAQQKQMSDYLWQYARLYPCGYCADRTVEELTRKPPAVDSQRSLSQWMCETHNEVNDRLGYPIFDCRRVRERWKTGPDDGACD